VNVFRQLKKVFDCAEEVQNLSMELIVSQFGRVKGVGEGRGGVKTVVC
jgi:hypothetical protein